MSTFPRRHFLKTAALGALVGPNILRAADSKQKIRVACVGIGQMGGGAVQASRDEEIVAFCDVDWRDLGGRSALKRPATQPCEHARVNGPPDQGQQQRADGGTRRAVKLRP